MLGALRSLRMNILVIGAGGREHALSLKLASSSLSKNIYVLPGNKGMEVTPKVTLIEGKVTDLDFILDKAKELMVELVIIGPEVPLALGLADLLEEHGVKVVGPKMAAAKLESSKAFSKEFMNKYNIPTAKAKIVKSYEEGLDVLKELATEFDTKNGVVVKADELAAGKGVVVADDTHQAANALYDFLKNPNCTVKSKQVLLEERLIGKEVSAFALCDGDQFITLGYACDYKRVFDDNKGPNTGGMGAYCPEDWPSAETKKYIEREIFQKVLDGMKAEGTPYKGILFAGLMINENESQATTPDVNVIEFNVRLGDPETQVLLPLIEDDLVPILMKAATGDLSSLENRELKKVRGTGIHVVMTSKGYPSTDGTPMILGNKISYPEKLSDQSASFLFFAGVKQGEEGELVNSGGRVLGVTCIGDELFSVRENVYREIMKIGFEGAHWRNDIGC
jgi:phosphoribosylamine--glycine ligase